MDQALPRYLRTKKAAEFIGIGKTTLYRWCEQGLIAPPIKLSGRCSVWRLADLEAFIASRQEASHEAN